MWQQQQSLLQCRLLRTAGRRPARRNAAGVQYAASFDSKRASLHHCVCGLLKLARSPAPAGLRSRPGLAGPTSASHGWPRRALLLLSPADKELQAGRGSGGAGALARPTAGAWEQGRQAGARLCGWQGAPVGLISKANGCMSIASHRSCAPIALGPLCCRPAGSTALSTGGAPGRADRRVSAPRRGAC